MSQIESFFSQGIVMNGKIVENNTLLFPSEVKTSHEGIKKE